MSWKSAIAKAVYEYAFCVVSIALFILIGWDSILVRYVSGLKPLPMFDGLWLAAVVVAIVHRMSDYTKLKF